jgi:hypothetical protein
MRVPHITGPKKATPHATPGPSYIGQSSADPDDHVCSKNNREARAKLRSPIHLETPTVLYYGDYT